MTADLFRSDPFGTDARTVVYAVEATCWDDTTAEWRTDPEVGFELAPHSPLFTTRGEVTAFRDWVVRELDAAAQFLPEESE